MRRNTLAPPALGSLSGPLSWLCGVAVLCLVGGLTTQAAEVDVVVDASDPGLVDVEPSERRYVATDAGYMVAYSERLPGTEVTFDMVPIAGGTFRLGSPDSEADRQDDEGPQATVRVPPMWVGRCEVSWAEYHAYMAMYEAAKQLNEFRFRVKRKQSNDVAAVLSKWDALLNYVTRPPDVDAVTCPTPIYDTSFTYEPGKDPDQPAVTMTHFGARQYTKWLSGITGRQYRLPTEAEWEYAARAGTTTAYSFGDDPAELADYAWFADNSDDQTHAVGSKRPNAWGLYDMRGNVAEWVLDEYDESHYASLAHEPTDAVQAIRWPTVLYPRVIRGGSWYDDPEMLRSAARYQSEDEEWNMSDPNLPKSPWWFTEFDSTGVGMRVVRPLEPMEDATLKRVWDADLEDTRFDVEDRLAEGRGVQTSATPNLPAAVEQLDLAQEELEAAGLIGSN